MNSLFSIVVPVYNAEDYLAECLESIARQSFRAFELVVVDDGSSDSSLSLAKSFASGKDYVKIYSKPNGGRLLARRDGAKLASGEYIVFLDSDDALRSDSLDVLAAEVERSNADIMIFGMSHEADFSRPQFAKDLPFGFFGGTKYRIAPQCVVRGSSNTLCGKAIRLATLDLDADYSSYQGLMHGEDLFQLLPVMDKARSCAHIQEGLYFYRQHEGASTATYKPKQLDDIAIVAGRLMEYGERWGMVEDAAYGALWNIAMTTRLLVDSASPVSFRDSELDRVGAYLRELGLERYLTGQRFDNKILFKSILAGRHREASLLVSAVECVKKIKE